MVVFFVLMALAAIAFLIALTIKTLQTSGDTLWIPTLCMVWF
jgi:hypothetical protein